MNLYNIAKLAIALRILTILFLLSFAAYSVVVKEYGLAFVCFLITITESLELYRARF